MRSENGKNAGTIAGRVFNTLRQDLLRGRFQPGEKLAISLLRDTYQVGLSPLREALNRLAASGLLYQEDQRGFRVPKLHSGELEDIMQLRIEFEGMAISRTIQNGDVKWESELLAVGRRLKLANDVDTPLVQWEGYHSRFHEVLLSACGSEWLLKFIRQLHEQFDRYRRSAPRNSKIREALNVQHGELVTLALDRNETSAKRLIEDHIRLSYEVAVLSCS